MMKRLLMTLATCLVAGAALAGSASEKRAAMHHLATVMAAQNLCPSIAANPVRMALISEMYGIALQGSDMGLVMADARDQIESMKGMDENAVCASAMALYGPHGMNVPNLLHKK